jgi:hypothetical protein
MKIPEKDIKVLMLSLKLIDTGDMERRVLDQKNENYVVDIALSLTDMSKRSQILLSDNASDLDCLKNEQFKSQARLLEVQDELIKKKYHQLETVKDTVDEKLTTLSSVIKKDHWSYCQQKRS